VQIEEQQSLIGSLQSDRTQMQDRLQQMQGTVEQVHLLETSLKETEDMLTDAQARNQSLQASKDVITTGLQLEIELLRQQVASLESTLHTERGYLSELRHDKETLQKQLELVTLRLPAPRVGFGVVSLVVEGRKKTKRSRSWCESLAVMHKSKLCRSIWRLHERSITLTYSFFDHLNTMARFLLSHVSRNPYHIV